VSENNESGNRWEKPAEADESTDAEAVDTPTPPVVEPAETPEADAQPVAPTASGRTIAVPTWMTKRGLIATAAAAAIFVGGGGVGYAVGVHHHGDNRSFPGRFDRAGFNGQMPGGGQGPGFQQGPQNQSQGQSQSNGSGTTS